MKKKVMSVLLSTAMAAALMSGCGSSAGKESSTAGEEKSAGGSKTVTMMCWYTEDDMQRVIDAINEKLGGEYQVEYTYITNSDYNNVLSTQLAAGEGPDVIADGANFPARIKAGNIKEITGTGLTDGFSKVGLALCLMDGKNYGIPCYGWFAGVFYNTELFRQSGITETPKTYDEFLEACKKLSSNGVKPLALGLADGDNGLHSVCGFLESNFYETSDAGKEFDTGFAKGEKTMAGTLNDSMEKWMQMVDQGYITPEMVGISGNQAKDEFMAGKAGMYYSGPWEYENFKNAGHNFISCTTENIYHQGRKNTYPKRRGLTRVKELYENGINVCFAQDSIQDPWYPAGNGNLMNVLDNGIHIAQMMSFEEMDNCLDLITVNGAKTMNISDIYGIEAGKPANFIVVDARSEFEAVCERADVVASVRNGEYLFKKAPVAFEALSEFMA